MNAPAFDLGARALATRPRPSTAALLPGRRIGFLGTSITNGSSAADSWKSYPYQLIEMLGTASVAPIGAGSLVSGHPGATSTTIKSHLRTLLTGVDIVVLEQGVNDAGQGVSLAVYAANMLEQFKACRAAGVQLVVLTIPPRGTNASPTAAQNLAIDMFNAWLRMAVPQFGTLIDIAAAMQNAAVSYNNLHSGFDSGDGTHPNSLGHWTMAYTIAAALRPLVRRPRVIGGFSAFNLVGNPYFFGNSSTGWFEQPGGSGAAPTYSFQADTSGQLGKGVWREMDFAPGAGSGGRTLATAIASGFAPGDVLAFTCKLQIMDVAGNWRAIGPGAAGTGFVSASIVNAGSGAAIAGAPSPLTSLGYPSAANQYDIGPTWQTFTAPESITSYGLWFRNSLPTGANIKMRVGEVGLINLTAAGMAGVPLA